MAAMGCRSIRDFARRAGQDHSVVARHLRVLTLPDEVISFLEENQTPEVLRKFHVKRLVALGRLPREQCLEEFSTEAGSELRAESHSCEGHL